MNGHVTTILVVYLINYIDLMSAQDGTDAKELRKTLFETSDYDKYVRPRINQSDIITVNMSLALLSILELSESEEILRTSSFVSLFWHDDYLTWNISDYGNIIDYQYPQEHVWQPGVTLRNNIEGYKKLGEDGLFLEVFYDGEIRWYPFHVFQSTCPVDIYYFPFDTHKCDLSFQAWSYTANAVILQDDGNGVDLQAYQQSVTWDVISTEITTEIVSQVSVITFTIELRRKPQFFIISTLLPIVMLGVLNIAVFILPCDSGEKAGYAITVFLALAVFLTNVSSTFPESSDSVAIFSVLLIILTLQSTFIALIALIMIRLNSYDDSLVPVPKYLCLFLDVLTLRCCLKRRKVDVLTKKQMGTNIVQVGISGVDQEHEPVEGYSPTFKPNYSWKQAMSKLDKICFMFFLGVLLASFGFSIVIIAGS